MTLIVLNENKNKEGTFNVPSFFCFHQLIVLQDKNMGSFAQTGVDRAEGTQKRDGT